MITGSIIYKSLLIVLTSILIDFVLGVLISIKDTKFDISLLPKFIATNIFPYVGGLVVLAFLALYLPEMSYLYYGAVSMVTLKFSKEALFDKIKQLFQD